MKYIFITIFIIFPFTAEIHLSAQNGAFHSLNLRIKGSKSLKTKDYMVALSYYDSLHSIKPGNMHIGFKLAELYEQTRQYEKAMDMYKKLYESDPVKNLLALYSFGKMAMSAGEYRLAKRGFDRFLDNFKPTGKNKHLRRQADRYTRHLELLIQKDTVHKISPVQKDPFFVNHYSYLNFAPFGIKRVDEAQNPEKRLNPEQNKKIPGGFRCVDNYFYFSREMLTPKNRFGSAIFRMKRDSTTGNWNSPEKLPSAVNLKKSLNLHPTIGKDARTGEPVLYFVSNRPDGKGGLDIWYSRYDRRRNRFREPKNAGSKINTPEDEFSPYYNNATRTLYFSSEGHPGYGSFDVYKAVGEQRKWTDPVNLGGDVNSPADDYFFYPSVNEDTFYMASNRNSEKVAEIPDDDFYSYVLPDKVTFKIQLEFTPVDNPLMDKQMLHKFDSIEMKTIKKVLVETFTDEDVLLQSDSVSIGKQHTIIADPEKNYKILTITGNDTSATVIKPNNLNRNEVSKHKIPVNNIVGFHVMKRIHHTINQTHLDENNTSIIDSTVVKLLEKYPESTVHINSYTDNTGSKLHNKRLSVRRAKNVSNHLKDKGLTGTKVNFEGHGPVHPLVPEIVSDGSIDNKARQLNRRTEIIINFQFQ